VSRSTGTRDRGWVAARRATVRALHPDRGGDSDAFIAALAALDSMYGHLPGVGQSVPVTVIVLHPRWRRFTAGLSRAMRRLSGTAHHYGRP
jgi:hypothetical protein